MRDLLTVPVRPEENVYLVRSLEGAGEAVMFAAPIRLSNRQRWSWTLHRVVQVTAAEARKLARLRNWSAVHPLSSAALPPSAAAASGATTPGASPTEAGGVDGRFTPGPCDRKSASLGTIAA